MDSKRKVCSLDIWPVSMLKDTFIVWSEAPFVLTWPLPGFWMAGAPCRKKCDSVPCFQALNWKNISFCQDSPLTSSLNDYSWMMSSSWDRWGWNETILTTFVSLQPFQVMGKDMNPLPVSVSYQLPLQPTILKPGYACYPFLGCRADTMHLFLQVDLQPPGCEHWAFSMNIKSSPGFQKWTGHFPASRTPDFQVRLSLPWAFPAESWVWWAQSHCRQRPVPALPSPSSERWRELWAEKSLLQEIAMLFLFPLMAKTRESNIFQGEKKKEHKSGWTNAQFLLSKWRDKVIDAGAEDFIPVLSKWPSVRWQPLTCSFSRGGSRV